MSFAGCAKLKTASLELIRLHFNVQVHLAHIASYKMSDTKDWVCGLLLN